GEADADKRPSVQIGDPFTGKKLIEASLELVERGLVESLQDCGAAGLASALAEMARDGAGVDVHLDRVPLREPGLAPWAIVSPKPRRCTSATTTSSARGRCAGRGWMPRCCACVRRFAGWPSRSRGHAPGRAIRSRPGSRPCSAPRAMWRARAASPWA